MAMAQGCLFTAFPLDSVAAAQFEDRQERPWFKLARDIEAGKAMLLTLAAKTLPPSPPAYLGYAEARSMRLPDEVRAAFNAAVYDLRLRGGYMRQEAALEDGAKFESRARTCGHDGPKHLALLEPARAKFAYSRTAFLLVAKLTARVLRAAKLKAAAAARKRGGDEGAAAAAAAAAEAAAAGDDGEELTCAICFGEIDARTAMLPPCAHLACDT